MGKLIIVVSLILLGLFGVFIINTKTEVKPTDESPTLNLSSVSPTPTPVIINSMDNQTSSASSQAQSTTVVIKTSKGDIELTLYSKDAPNTVNNFVQKAKIGFYNNLIFHRVEDWVIQGGDPLGNGTGGGNMATELNNKPFVVGSLGVARGQDINISNDAQFFITKADASWLNGQYTNFGIVTKGMDVVNKIQIGDKILKVNIN